MIKNIDKKNIPECVQLIKNSFLTVAREFNITPKNAPRFTAFSISESKLEKQFISNSIIMRGYFENEKIIGYYSLKILCNDICELNNLCVLPDYRHRLIGNTLLTDAVLQSKNTGCKKMTIGIVEENTILRRWYEKHGFVHTGTEKFDFFPFTCGYMEKIL